MSSKEDLTKSIAFRIQDIYSHVSHDVFLISYLSTQSTPRIQTIRKATEMPIHFRVQGPTDELLLIFQMYCVRTNDDDIRVTQYIGSTVMDIRECRRQDYTVRLMDTSIQPSLYMGHVALTMTTLPPFEMESAESQIHDIHSTTCIRRLYDAAEANLTWIDGFHPKGLLPIVHGLKRVHSPYYVNHLGITMPSGAFCMIPTSAGIEKKKALESYEQRLSIALCRNTCTEEEFISGCSEMMSQNIRSKHIRCLAIVADMLTLHTRMDVNYTPDVRFTPEATSTERWEIPREPSPDGKTMFTGDCEDYAREIYQHCKELRSWVYPKCDGTALEALSAVLQLYVPTIEQGAVDHRAHSKYITYEAEYRNHIWAALHPRESWRTKCTPPCNLEKLYKKWPRQEVEATLPVLHLEGTGDVYPVVTARKPGFIAKIQKKRSLIDSKYPWIQEAETPDMSLQCDHKSNFYKFSIACMTDVFAGQNILDFTYTTGARYGVDIYRWARGQYQLRPSTRHSKTVMKDIQRMLTIERPIPPIITKSKIITKPRVQGYALRYGQSKPFVLIPSDARQGVYKIGEHMWYELYFAAGGMSGTASSNDASPDLMLI
jgi:hypothetical protein